MNLMEADWKDCEQHIGAGVFEDRAQNLNMQNCNITIARDDTCVIGNKPIDKYRLCWPDDFFP